MNKVDPSVPDEYKVKLRQLLLRNSAAFSRTSWILASLTLLLITLTQATHDLSVNSSGAIHLLIST